MSTARGRAEYRKYLQTRGWRRRANRARRRAHYRCQVCNCRRRLDVHHLSYKHRGRERRNELVAVCHGCHQVAHGAKF